MNEISVHVDVFRLATREKIKSEDNSVESLTLNSSIQLVFSEERIHIDDLGTKD